MFSKNQIPEEILTKCVFAPVTRTAMAASECAMGTRKPEIKV